MSSHVIFMLIERLRPQQLGCYAHKDVGTPNLDGLAQRGVIFENAISQGSCTRPSVASFMTGLYPSEHGLVDRIAKGTRSVTALDRTLLTLPELLATSGYTSAAFIGGNANLKPEFGLSRGFSHLQWCQTTDGNILIDNFERWLRTELPQRMFCYLHSMDLYDSLPAVKPILSPELNPQRSRAIMTDFVDYYTAAVRRVDQQIGRVICALESLGILEEALIIITSDHGEELFEHRGMLVADRSLYREFVHVPLVMKMPGWAYSGKVIDQPIQLIDLKPTLLDQLQILSANVSGRSLMPLMRGEITDVPTLAFSELSRSDRYIQCVTSRTHHFIKTYFLEKFVTASPKDLRPGLWVEIDGESSSVGAFQPTKVSPTQKEKSEIEGVVELVDTASGLIRIIGLNLQTDGGTTFKGWGQVSFGLADLRVGTKINVAVTNSDGSLMATRIKKISDRESESKSKIMGVIERKMQRGGDYITVLRKDILIDDNTRIGPLRQKSLDALARVLAGEFIEKQCELYDITRDAAETQNVVEEQVEVAQELERFITDWTQSLAIGIRRPAGSVHVNAETLEQLRLLGYEASVCKHGVIWENRLTRSALPKDESGWRWLRDQGVNTVVTFLRGDEVDYQKFGFKRFLRLALNKNPPTQAQAENFLSFIQDSDNWPVHIHCAEGRGRTGLMAALVRHALDGWPVDKALAEARLYREGKELSSERVHWLRGWAANHKPQSAVERISGCVKDASTVAEAENFSRRFARDLRASSVEDSVRAGALGPDSGVQG